MPESQEGENLGSQGSRKAKDAGKLWIGIQKVAKPRKSKTLKLHL